MKVLTDLVFEIYMIIFLDNMLLASWLKLKQIISPKMLNNLKETCRARAILVLDITETVLGLKEHRSSFKVITLTVKNKQKATAESENYQNYEDYTEQRHYLACFCFYVCFSILTVVDVVFSHKKMYF